MKGKKILWIGILFMIILSGCSLKTEDALEDTQSSSEQQEQTDVQGSAIEFGTEISAEENVTVEGNTATITEAGDYTVTGTSEDGQLIINAPSNEVNLTLEDLDLTASNTSAITVVDAKQLNITLSGENILSDTASNTDQYQAPIYIDEVETHIDGDGILNLNGNYQEGFESNNDLYIDGGTLNINAVDDGINAGDLLSINGGTINIDCDGDGLDSNGDLEITGGTTYVSGGNNGNGPIDYGDESNTFTLTGGTVIATGGNMGVTPTEEGQTFYTATANGTSVEVGDYTYDAPKQFSYVFVSYPELTEDTSLYVDGSEVTTSSKISTSSSMGGGNMGSGPMGGAF